MVDKVTHGEINPLIFREYDIRGVVDKDLTEPIVELIGRAYGTYMRRMNKRNVTVGGDCRLSTERLRTVLIKGITTTGCNVTNLGITTSPILYFSLFHLKTDGGVMITGSHNPADFNGFKICVDKNTIYGEEIQRLRKIMESGDFETGAGTVTTYDIVTEYKKYMVDNFTFKRKLKVAIDAGNGTGGEVAVPILKELGVDVIPLNCTMDGHFPSHHPDPTKEENLTQIIEAVKREGLDMGIAFDGDADRLGAVDNKGRIIWGDKLLILYAREILKRKPGATIISEVKASRNLYEDIKRHGGKGIMWKAGHSLIKAKMKEVDAALAGEVSGHVFFADRYFGYDDAIYGALRLIEIVANDDKPLSVLLSDIPQTYVTPEMRFECDDEKKFMIVEEVKSALEKDYQLVDIDGVRVVFDDGWGLVRASNTQPALVMRFEANTKERLEEIRTLVETTVKEIKERS